MVQAKGFTAIIGRTFNENNQGGKLCLSCHDIRTSPSLLTAISR